MLTSRPLNAEHPRPAFHLEGGGFLSTALHLLVFVISLCGCSLWQEPPDPIAYLQAMNGEVTQESSGKVLAAQTGAKLFEGDIISTGNGSSARLTFEGGNVIELGANASLVIRRTGVAVANIGGVLLAGQATATSEGRGVILTIGTPFGMTRLGDSASELLLDAKKGIEVLVGQISVALQDGQIRQISAGSMMSIEGIVVPVSGVAANQGTDESNIVLDPITIVLTTSSQQTQIKRKDESNWQRANKSDTLNSGDSIRSRRGSDTAIEFGDNAAVKLAPQTQLVLGDSHGNADIHQATYSLNGGTAHIEIDAKNDIIAVHEVHIDNTSLRVRPGLEKALVDLTAGPGGRSSILVRQGVVELPNSTIIEAGTAATLQDGVIKGSVFPLAKTGINLKPASSTVVNYKDSIPPVAFSWPENSDAAGGYEFEIATDRDFEKTILRERISRNQFVYDRLEPGRYYWRVRTKDDLSRGTIKIQKSVEQKCRHCKRTNVINDTGEKTVVYFQKVLPAITFRWEPVEGAVKYRLKLFSDGDFNAPKVDSVVDDTFTRLESGRITEGKYYWLVSAINQAGNDISTGKTNSLEIAYDNAIPDLLINSPAFGAKVTKSRVATYGEVPLGARLYIDDREIEVDRQGRFRDQVRLSKGLNILFFHTLGKNGIEYYYPHEVTRR
ncbi:MAG: hypothetical protein R3C68_07530 [Myxococcota bacterium]